MHFISGHIIIDAIFVAWVGALYGWKRLTAYYRLRGKPIPALGGLISRTIKFALKEDNQPVVTKPKKLAAKFAWLTGTRAYLALIAITAVAVLTGLFSPIPSALILAVLLGRRTRRTFRQRWSIQMQMFNVASAECKYPREAPLSPWGYIGIKNWHNIINPGQTVVTYPASFQSEDVKTREKFERQFNGTISDEHSWTYKWESSKNRVICTPAPYLPTMVKYPGSWDKPWNEFPIGMADEGKEAIWDVLTFPHSLVCGPTGSGKSVLQRMILFHALQHDDVWKIVGVDPKMVEMGWLKKYPSVLKIALTLEDGVEVITSVRDEMRRRYEEMSELGVNNAANLSPRPPALLVMIDETFNFLAPEGVKSDEGKERDQLHAQAQSMMGEIARLGRACMIFLCCATQRPDATVIKGEFKNNLDCRIAAGRLDTIPSLMVLDSEAATRLPKVRGRGMIRLGAELTTYQGYFAEQDWFDSFAEARENGTLPESTSGKAGLEVAPSRFGRFIPAGLAGWLARRKESAQAADAKVLAAAGGDAPQAGGDAPKAQSRKAKKVVSGAQDPTLDDALADQVLAGDLAGHDQDDEIKSVSDGDEGWDDDAFDDEDFDALPGPAEVEESSFRGEPAVLAGVPDEASDEVPEVIAPVRVARRSEAPAGPPTGAQDAPPAPVTPVAPLVPVEDPVVSAPAAPVDRAPLNDPWPKRVPPAVTPPPEAPLTLREPAPVPLEPVQVVPVAQVTPVPSMTSTLTPQAEVTPIAALPEPRLPEPLIAVVPEAPAVPTVAAPAATPPTPHPAGIAGLRRATPAPPG